MCFKKTSTMKVKFDQTKKRNFCKYFFSSFYCVLLYQSTNFMRKVYKIEKINLCEKTNSGR